MRRLTLAFLAVAIFVPGLVLSQVKLPKTPVREVAEDYFGTAEPDLDGAISDGQRIIQRGSAFFGWKLLFCPWIMVFW